MRSLEVVLQSILQVSGKLVAETRPQHGWTPRSPSVMLVARAHEQSLRRAGGLRRLRPAPLPRGAASRASQSSQRAAAEPHCRFPSPGPGMRPRDKALSLS